MMISTGDHAAMIPEEEIEAIRRAVDGSCSRIEPHPFLKCGERVRIKRGTLEGLEGILVRKKNLCRLILSVEMLAQSIAVEIDASSVEPMTPHNAANAFREPIAATDGRLELMPTPWQVSGNTSTAFDGHGEESL